MKYRGKNKTTYDRLFSNCNEYMIWMDNNCEQCWRHLHYESRQKKFNCSIDRDIQLQDAGLFEISLRSYNIVKSGECLLKCEKRPDYYNMRKKKRNGSIFEK